MKRFLLVLMLSCSGSAVAVESSPWLKMMISGGAYTVLSFAPAELRRANTLNIFIEGDGAPGMALSLAQYVGGNSVYISRPCQYAMTACSKELWTSHRYSPAVISAMNRAITALKVRYGADNVRLIGYSGGAAIASLAAIKRDDVLLLLTVAGNLDHKRWTEFNQIPPLTGSLNPVDYSEALENIPQIHLIGDRDTVVPGSILTSYLAQLHHLDNVNSHIILGADHFCCWSAAVANFLHQ